MKHIYSRNNKIFNEQKTKNDINFKIDLRNCMWS